jgi:peptide/nickel transport system ATP-binding protein
MTSSASTRPILAAQALSKVFPAKGARRAALSEVSLELYPGQALALVGESGSGKSTLLRILSRIEAATSGQVLFQGEDLSRCGKPHLQEFRRRVQMIFQDPFASLNPLQRVRYHLERPLILAGKAGGRETLSGQVNRLLENVGLHGAKDLAARFPHELSGGQRQRVAIARALATEPHVLLADEPTSMLDVSLRIGILNLFKELCRERGIALLYVTHDLKSARYVADELRVMLSGYIVEAGGVEDVLNAPAHPYTHELLAALPGEARRALPVTRSATLTRTGGEACPLFERCPRATEKCGETMPQPSVLPTNSGNNRNVRCNVPLLEQDGLPASS